MKFAAAVSALATMASAAAVAKPASPLDVKIEMVGNTGVKATVTNTGSEDLKIFKTGSILDKTPTEKVKITQGKSNVTFNGVRLRVMKKGLQEASFQVIPAGKTIEHTFDAAELHDLSVGGAVSMVSKGALQYAKAGSTEIIGSVPYSSNLLSATVDGIAASKVFKAYHAKAKRQAVQDDCSSSQASATSDAINTCAELAAEAASVAGSDDEKTCRVLQDRGFFDPLHSNVYGACEPGVIAYTLPSEEYMVNCPIFFSDLSPASSTCHDQDQWSTVLHETTHLTSVAGTDDYGGYGYDFVQSLSAEENLSHADTYALFAQSLYAGC
ncbi:hypothetical protein NPX13_g5584 [Xylaria arbuscula]|uniref:deuterolysin n=1 Tax=Xylaria arbuscula TaxID=114810 RepID=A0A9W8TM93_9PEZI|nr:hypothetical protein NPX13_g5584 [Xylaria arbuscula]